VADQRAVRRASHGIAPTAFAQHARGHAEREPGPVRAAAAAGLGLAAITVQLEREGVRSFCDSYRQLLGCIGRQIAAGAAQ